MSRTGRVERTTKESSVLVEIDLDGSGQADVQTGVPFFDHMLSQLGKHGGFDLTIRTTGDLEVDAHHTVEDTSLALGTAFREALGDAAGTRRFGDSLVPLDESLSQSYNILIVNIDVYHSVQYQQRLLESFCMVDRGGTMVGQAVLYRCVEYIGGVGGIVVGPVGHRPQGCTTGKGIGLGKERHEGYKTAIAATIDADALRVNSVFVC